MISDDVREEILERVNIVELISEYVNLTKKGKNYMGLCPFHSEKTPSFSVSEDKGLFHCFGCGASGNTIGFVMKIHNFDFPEAVEFLAEKYGIEIKRNSFYKEEKNIIDINERIMLEAKKCLFSTENKHVLNYLLDRGLSSETIDEFDLGFLPETIDHSIFTSNYKSSDLFDTGNFIKLKDGLKLRFLGRIIFPIKNERGKVIGFSGRSLDNTQPKYLNTPESKIFKKRGTLYNLNSAKKYIKEEKHVFLVEGYFDVIRMWISGFKNTVSPMGTSFTKEQAAILKRYTDEGTIIFDGDEAGVNASFRAIDNCILSNFFPYVLFLPKGEDPDSYLLKNLSEFKNLLQKKVDILTFLFAQMYKRSKTHQQKLTNMKMLYKKVASIQEPFRKDFYEKELARIFNTDIELIKTETKIKKIDKNKSNMPKLSYICEDEFLISLFYLPEDVVDEAISDINEEMFYSEKNRKIFKKIVEVLNKSDSISTLFNDSEFGETLSSMAVNIDPSSDFYKKAIVNKYKIIDNYLEKRRKSLIEKLSKTNHENNSKDTNIKILKEIQEIINKQKEIKANLSEV